MGLAGSAQGDIISTLSSLREVITTHARGSRYISARMIRNAYIKPWITFVLWFETEIVSVFALISSPSYFV
jgi:hypothetical protein